MSYSRPPPDEIRPLLAAWNNQENQTNNATTSSSSSSSSSSAAAAGQIQLSSSLPLHSDSTNSFLLGRGGTGSPTVTRPASLYSNSPTNPPAAPSSNEYYQSGVSFTPPSSFGHSPQSYQPRQSRPVYDRLHHLPPPHLHHSHTHTNVLTTTNRVSTPTLSSFLPSLSLGLSSASPVASSSSPSIPPIVETKRVEIIEDASGKPLVREEPEWPKPKKNAQYDEDLLFDYHSLLLYVILAATAAIFYFFCPTLHILSNPTYIWVLFVLISLIVYHLSQLLETLILKLLSAASGTRVWKVYFYSQAFHETLGNIMTIIFLLYCRYSKWIPIVWPVEVTQYYDPLCRFALLMFVAVLIREIITKHLTYAINQERYSKAVQDLLFKSHVLARLCNPFAYQPLTIRTTPISGLPIPATPFPYTPLRKKHSTNTNTNSNSEPGTTSSAGTTSGISSTKSTKRPHPLYDIFLKLRDFNESISDDYLPGGTGSQFFSSEKMAKAKAKELFRNVDRERKGFIDIVDFRAFFPKETALRAFKLFFPPKVFKFGGTSATAAGEKKKRIEGGEGKEGTETEKGSIPLPFIDPEADSAAASAGGSEEGKSAKKKKKLKPKEKQKGKETDNDSASASASDPVSSEKSNKSSTKKRAEAKAAKREEKAEMTGSPESKENPSDQASQFPKSASGTILNELVTVNKAKSGNAAADGVSGLPPSDSMDSSAHSSPSPLPDPDSPSVGDLLASAASDQESHLLSLRLTYSALESRILGFHESRQTLSRQLRDLDGLADVMQSLSNMTFWVVVGFMMIIIFDEHVQPLIFTLSTLLLSLTFVFAGTLKEIFNAVILIFAIKPYSVGDRVNIGKDKFRVHSIQLLTTTFRDLQNKISIMSNQKLATSTVQNLTRSGNVVVKMKLAVALDTPATKLAALRTAIVKHVTNLPTEWKGQVSMHLADLAPQLNTVNVSLLLSHLASYTQVKQWKTSKTELLHVIRQEMIRLGIAWKNPESTVSLVNPEALKDMIQTAGMLFRGNNLPDDNNGVKLIGVDEKAQTATSGTSTGKKIEEWEGESPEKGEKAQMNGPVSKS